MTPVRRGDSPAMLSLDTVTGWSAVNGVRKLEPQIIKELGRRNPVLKKTVAGLDPQFRQWLFASTVRRPRSVSPLPSRPLLDKLAFLSERRKALLIGVWDVGADIRNELTVVLSRINEVQKQLVFVDVIAPVPAGLTTQPELLKRYNEHYGNEPDSYSEEDFEPTVLAETFLPLALATMQETGLNRLVGVTASGVGDASDGVFEWDNLTATSDVCSLVSTKYLIGIAAKAKRPVSVFVAWLILGQLLVDVSDELEYHAEDRVCLFDENADDFSTLPEAVIAGRIEQICLDLIAPHLKEPAIAIAKALSSIKKV